MNNSTIDISGSFGTAIDDEHEYFPLAKFISSLVDVIWEQSEQSSSMNTTPWNRLGAISKYCCSIYGLACLVMALVLNRTLVMASTNNLQQQQVRRGQFNQAKLASSTIFKNLSMISFRVGVILLFLYQIYNILIVLNLHYHLGLTQDSSLNWIYRYIADLLFQYDAEFFNDTKYMKTPGAQVMVGPTSDMYWPIFLTFCLLSFIETFIASIEGKKPYTESGITIFEHSLAFQEFSSNGAFFFGSSKYYKRPTEQVLLTTLFLILNHLNIHIGAIINDNKYRLIPLTVFGMTFLGYFISSFTNGWGFLQFPLILVLTFTPQVLILFIILISLAIFLLAVVVNGFRLRGLNYASLFMRDSRNELDEEDTNLLIKNLNINLNDDFYTALLNVGILAITLAGRSSYITELSLVNLEDETWVDRSIWERLKWAGHSSRNGTSRGVVQYLQENQLVGYGNVIAKPTQRLISGNYLGDYESSNIGGRTSVLKKRTLYLKDMIVYTWQLLYGLVVDSFILEYIPNLFKKVVLGKKIEKRPYWEEETEDEFEKRKLKTPPFLRKYVTRRVSRKKKDLVNIDSFTQDEVSQSYAKILLSTNDISEVDNSGDYNEVIEEETDLEYDSDVDEVVFTPGTVASRNPTFAQKQAILPIHELFDGKELHDVLVSSNTTYLDILQKHMQYGEENGRLTRSKYQSLAFLPLLLFQSTDKFLGRTEEDSETARLLDILISKRLEKGEQSSRDDDSARSLDCVICQTNVREIITWPCKCFAICESCRLSLVSKGIEGCVCCRREVEGVSKIFIP